MIGSIRKYGLFLVLAAVACLVAVPAAPAEEAPAPVAAAAGASCEACAGAGQALPFAAPDSAAGTCGAPANGTNFVIAVPSRSVGEVGQINQVETFCCSVYGCCDYIGSGCQNCPEGGLRFYDTFACPGGRYGCTEIPINCPTPC